MGGVPQEASADISQYGTYKDFLIKTCIIAIVMSLSVIFVVDWTIQSVEDSISRTGDNMVAALSSQIPTGGRKFWTEIERNIDLAAAPNSDLAPEKKQRILNDVRIIVARWRPFIEAVSDGMEKPPQKAN
jgi:hypothetical protein